MPRTIALASLLRAPAVPALLWPAAAALLLLLAWPGLSGPFIFDDFPNLEKLRLVGGQLDREHVGNYLANFHGNPGRPLAALSFLLNDTAWPSTPWSFKYTNLMLHALAGLMAFGLARAVALANAPAADEAQRHGAIWLALLASTIWMLHPMQATTVFLVVQRMAILSALFVMAGLWAYVALLRRARSTAGVFVALAVLATFAALAFMCKENGALAPLYAWVLQATVLRPLVAQLPTRGRSLARWAIPTSALLPFAALLATPDKWLEFANREFTAGQRLMTQPRVLTDYLQAIIMPRLGGGGSIYHDGYAFSTSWMAPPSTILSALIIGSSLLLALRFRRRWPWPALAVLWFLAGHSVESTFLSLELYFEHRNYLPSFGIAIAGAYAVANAPVRWRRVALATAIAWLAIAAFVTRAQAEVWGDERLLAETWAAEHPNSNRAVQTLAKVYYEHGQPAEARAVFERALTSGRGSRNAQLYLLLIDCYVKQSVGSDDLRRSSLMLQGEMPDLGTYALLQSLRERAHQQRCGDFTLSKWLTLSEAALQNPRAHHIYLMHHERARAFAALGQANAALASLIAAYGADPIPERAYVIASHLMSQQRYGEAVAWARAARDAPYPSFKAWMSQRETRAERMIEVIERERSKAQREGAGAKRPPTVRSEGKTHTGSGTSAD